MMNNREISLETGVGELLFTMNEQEIIEKLGKPDCIDNDNLNDCIAYYYDDLNLGVIFVEIENKLVIENFELEDDSYTLFGTPIVNQPYHKMINFFEQNNIVDFEMLDDELDKHIIYQNLFISFYSYNKGNVSDICLSNPNL